MKWRTLIPALGLAVATLALPGTAEASHRYARSCGRGYYHSGFYSARYFAPYARVGYYYAPPPAYYYRPYARPYYYRHFRPVFRGPYRPASYLNFGFRF